MFVSILFAAFLSLFITLCIVLLVWRLKADPNCDACRGRGGPVPAGPPTSDCVEYAEQQPVEQPTGYRLLIVEPRQS